MSLKLNRDFIEVVGNNGNLQGNVITNRLVDISVEVLFTDGDIPCGIRCVLGNIIYTCNLIDEDGQRVECDYEQLVLCVKNGLHLILNEKEWDFTLLSELELDEEDSILKIVEKNSAFFKGTNDKVLRLYLDNFIFFNISTVLPYVFEEKQKQEQEKSKDIENNKNEKKNENKIGLTHCGTIGIGDREGFQKIFNHMAFPDEFPDPSEEIKKDKKVVKDKKSRNKNKNKKGYRNE